MESKIDFIRAYILIPVLIGGASGTFIPTLPLSFIGAMLGSALWMYIYEVHIKSRG